MAKKAEQKKEKEKEKDKQESKEKEKKAEKAKETNYSKNEIEEIIVNLSKEGHRSDKIGLILRDNYGIGDIKALSDKKISKILKERGKAVFPSDLEALTEKVKILKKHFERNKHDYVSKRALQILEARVRILTNYYKKKGILK